MQPLAFNQEWAKCGSTFGPSLLAVAMEAVTLAAGGSLHNAARLAEQQVPANTEPAATVELIALGTPEVPGPRTLEMDAATRPGTGAASELLAG